MDEISPFKALDFIRDNAIRNCLYDCKTQDFLQFARAIEKAHGIGE